jgi:hypothetical protein
MHRMSRLNKFKDSSQVLEKNPRLCLMRKKNSRTHKECQTTFFVPRFLPQTPYVLMCIKCMNVTITKCLIAM